MLGTRCQARAVRRLGIAGHHPAWRHRHGFRRTQAKFTVALPCTGLPLVARHVHLVHARIQHCHHLRAAVLLSRCFGHSGQRVDGQHRHAAPTASAKGQALGHGAGGAQSGERAGAATKNDGVELAEVKLGFAQQAQDGGQQRGRCLRPTRPGVLPQRVATRHGNGQGVGAGVKGKQLHGLRGLKR